MVFHNVTLSKIENGRQHASATVGPAYWTVLCASAGAEARVQLPEDMLPILEELQWVMDVGQHRLEHLDSEERDAATPATEWRPVNGLLLSATT